MVGNFFYFKYEIFFNNFLDFFFYWDVCDGS